MEEQLVSIIIPVYNTAEFLPRCIRSLLDGSYRNIELICVNDGSKDNSLAVLQELAAQDSRVRVLDGPNGGVASARNRGIEAASGSYIGFVDSDDWVHRDYVAHLMKVITEQGADAAACSFQSVKTEAEADPNPASAEPRRLSHTSLLNVNTAKFYVWGRLYSRELVGTMRFDARFSYGEDTIFNLNVLCRRDDLRFCYLDERLYYYLNRPESLVHNVNRSSIMYTARDGFLPSYDCYGAQKPAILEHCFRILLNARYLEMFNPDRTRTRECMAIIEECMTHIGDFGMKKRLFYILMVRLPFLYRLYRLASNPKALKSEKKRKKMYRELNK